MATNELKKILELHRKWLYGEPDGSWANLSRADLSWANLSWANLSGADLSGADLSGANLSRADLSWANLSGADLSWANLSGADLSRADLSGVNLSWANLSGADLSGVNLSWANLSGADLSGADLQNAIYAVAVILRAFWCLPPNAKHLTLELTAHDAESCGIEAMDKWASDKAGCPFSHSERDFYFQEDKSLWLSAKGEDKIPKLRGRKLLEALAEACKVKL